MAMRAPTKQSAPEPTLKYLNLTDFTPGIYSELQFNNANNFFIDPPGYPMGAQGQIGASEFNTVGCIAVPGGGLRALPGAAADVVPLPAMASSWVTIPGTCFITGMFVKTGYMASPTLSPLVWEYTDEVITMQEVFVNPPNANPRYAHNLQSWIEVGGQIHVLHTADVVNGNGIGALGGCPYMGIQTLASVPGSPGPLAPYLVIPFVSPDVTIINPFLWITSEGGTAPFGLSDLCANNFKTGLTFTHQGRIVTATINSSLGPNGFLLINNENFNYTDPPESTTFLNPGLWNGIIFWPENPSGYGAATSISAGELFLVKKSGGALFIAGDLNNPQVTYYPGVQSTGIMCGRASQTAIGAVYCSMGNGAWVWNGGNLANKLSPQLRDDFYTVPGPIPQSFQDYVGGLVQSYVGTAPIFGPENNFGFCIAQWGNLIVFSNNWVYDTVTNGWWRLQQVDSHNRPQTSPAFQNYFWFSAIDSDSDLWAAPASYANPTSGTADVIRRFDRMQSNPWWTWQSLPIRLSTDRFASIREIVLRGTAHGGDASTFIVTARDEYNQQFFTTSRVFPAGTTGPITLRIDTGGLKFTQSFTLEIQAQSTSYNTVISNPNQIGAPDLHSITIGYRDAEHAGPTTA